jgi:hypothetical protein
MFESMNRQAIPLKYQMAFKRRSNTARLVVNMSPRELVPLLQRLAQPQHLSENILRKKLMKNMEKIKTQIHHLGIHGHKLEKLQVECSADMEKFGVLLKRLENQLPSPLEMHPQL